MKKTKFTSYRIKVIFVIITVVTFTTLLMGILLFNFTKTILTNDYEQMQSHLEKRIIKEIEDTDKIYYLLESSIRKDISSILYSLKYYYEENGRINHNLEEYVQDYDGIDIYIINVNNQIIRSTNVNHIGLKYTIESHELLLDKIRSSNDIVFDRLNISCLNNVVTQNSYLPSDDGQYIFQVSVDINSYFNNFKEFSFTNFADDIIDEYSYVDSIYIYNESGVSYNLNSRGKRISVNQSFKPYFDKALNEHTPITVTKKINNNTYTYKYIPYNLIENNGNTNIVLELVYNNGHILKELNRIVIVFVTLFFISIILAIFVTSLMSSSITKPIKIFTEATNQLSIGNYDTEIHLETNDEFSILANAFNDMTSNMKDLISKIQESNKDLEESIRRNNQTYITTIKLLANAIEAKDSYTGGHCERVMNYSLQIAYEIDLDEDSIKELTYGSLLHDIGKIGIKESVLNKAGRFTQEDYKLMKEHPLIGYKILSELNYWYRVKRIVLEHHERVDGSGYPNNKNSTEIDLLSKIVCVADAYDAMTSARPYKSNIMTHYEAIVELVRCSGTQFDDRIVQAFIKSFNSI